MILKTVITDDFNTKSIHSNIKAERKFTILK